MRNGDGQAGHEQGGSQRVVDVLEHAEPRRREERARAKLGGAPRSCQTTLSRYVRDERCRDREFCRSIAALPPLHLIGDRMDSSVLLPDACSQAKLPH